jgi:Rrf2 family protein
MKLSKTSLYALYGLSYLAAQPRGRLVPLSEICTHYRLPRKHLAKVFHAFAKDGLLASTRGVSGGFSLRRPPDKVSVLEIVRRVEGAVELPSCLIVRDPCEDPDDCRVGLFVRRLQEGVLQQFRRTSLADLARRSSPPG